MPLKPLTGPQAISTSLRPTRQGPVGIAYDFYFGSETQFIFDMLEVIQQGQLDFVQSAWIDNTDNAQELRLTNLITRQRLRVPAFSQGTFPIFAAGKSDFLAEVTAVQAGLHVTVIFCNVLQPYYVSFQTGA